MTMTGVAMCVLGALAILTVYLRAKYRLPKLPMWSLFLVAASAGCLVFAVIGLSLYATAFPLLYAFASLLFGQAWRVAKYMEALEAKVTLTA